MGQHADFTQAVLSALNSYYANASDRTHVITDAVLGLRVTIEPMEENEHYLTMEEWSSLSKAVRRIRESTVNYAASGETSGPVEHNDNGAEERA